MNMHVIIHSFNFSQPSYANQGLRLISRKADLLIFSMKSNEQTLIFVSNKKSVRG